MELIVKYFEELTVHELYEILRLRVSVFVVEQQCPYQEIDGLDQRSIHVFMTDAGKIQAYLRVVDRGVAGEAWLGRVIAVKRRCGLGSRIMNAGIEIAKDRLHAQMIRVEAQTYAKPFYESLGFRQASEAFLEDGIPHIEMKLDCGTAQK